MSARPEANRRLPRRLSDSLEVSPVSRPVINAMSSADHDYCDGCGQFTVVTDVWIDRCPMTLCQPCVLDALTAEGEQLGQYWEIET